MQLTRRRIIIFHRIRRPQDFGIFTTPNCPHHFILHLKRKTGGKAVYVQLIGRNAFRLNEDLMGWLISKTHDLIFN